MVEIERNIYTSVLVRAAIVILTDPAFCFPPKLAKPTLRTRTHAHTKVIPYRPERHAKA